MLAVTGKLSLDVCWLHSDYSTASSRELRDGQQNCSRLMIKLRSLNYVGIIALSISCSYGNTKDNKLSPTIGNNPYIKLNPDAITQHTELLTGTHYPTRTAIHPRIYWHKDRYMFTDTNPQNSQNGHDECRHVSMTTQLKIVLKIYYIH